MVKHIREWTKVQVTGPAEARLADEFIGGGTFYGDFLEWLHTQLGPEASRSPSRESRWMWAGAWIMFYNLEDAILFKMTWPEYCM